MIPKTRQSRRQIQKARNSIHIYRQYSYKEPCDEIQASRLVSGVEAVFVKSGNTLVSVDTVSSEPDRTITGRFVNSSVKSGVVSIKIKPDDSKKTKLKNVRRIYR